MSLVVKKFGGTSVANIERIEFVADKIAAFYKKNHQIVVVVSAMKGETDQLENLAYKISKDPDLREMGALLATGEQIVISLLAIALIKRGYSARSYTGLQLGIETYGIPTKSKINSINISNIKKDLDAGSIVIVAGFQGVDFKEGNITTLGRGGSDTTAVALAIALNAQECDIYTDVDGVYTADPNLVPNAKKLNTINFEEMLELSGLGAKVMQIRAVELGSYYNMPIKVLSSFNTEDHPGTLICSQHTNNNVIDFSYQQSFKFATLKNQVKVCINHVSPIFMSNILANLSELQIDIDFFSSSKKLNESSYIGSFVINAKDLDSVKLLFIKMELKESCLSFVNVAKLSIIGRGLINNAKILHEIYSSLISVNIEPYQIVTSEIKGSILLDEKDLEAATNILHSRLVVDIDLEVDVVCDSNLDIAQ